MFGHPSPAMRRAPMNGSDAKARATAIFAIQTYLSAPTIK